MSVRARAEGGQSRPPRLQHSSLDVPSHPSSSRSQAIPAQSCSTTREPMGRGSLWGRGEGARGRRPKLAHATWTTDVTSGRRGRAVEVRLAGKKRSLESENRAADWCRQGCWEVRSGSSRGMLSGAQQQRPPSARALPNGPSDRLQRPSPRFPPFLLSQIYSLQHNHDLDFARQACRFREGGVVSLCAVVLRSRRSYQQRADLRWRTVLFFLLLSTALRQSHRSISRLLAGQG